MAIRLGQPKGRPATLKPRQLPHDSVFRQPCHPEGSGRIGRDESRALQKHSTCSKVLRLGSKLEIVESCERRQAWSRVWDSKI